MPHKLRIFFLLFFFSSTVFATDCPSHYAAGRAPEILNDKLARQTQELCYQAFAVMHSGVTRTPLWSAEHLTRSNIDAARTLSRENSFHPEPGLLISGRAELKDYARSGFDRGHMSPNGDMANRTSQYESFSLANMIPQNPQNNHHVWADIESAVRRLAEKDGELYVITGPAFLGQDLQKIGNVLVPTYIYKVVYSPRRQQAAAYFIKNEDTSRYQALSVTQLESTLRIDLLPGVPKRIKDVAMALPVAGQHGGRNAPEKREEPAAQVKKIEADLLSRLFNDGLKMFLNFITNLIHKGWSHV
ncbi:DNA/RNA non-specific endonuclease family protein [Collimonas fungivorans]|uniref:Endonuclease n=1 Tax=Collimonas fungivorans TaxID=158899 RepID=A0A127PG77_9BURK|nr:DNA/RNA non-specific endonuclease [Collimonas fungivorans]AMO96743.1 DNA/RNA non-specific endonuclease family protein [Collimonas fungivorans]